MEFNRKKNLPDWLIILLKDFYLLIRGHKFCIVFMFYDKVFNVWNKYVALAGVKRWICANFGNANMKLIKESGDWLFKKTNMYS